METKMMEKVMGSELVPAELDTTMVSDCLDTSRCCSVRLETLKSDPRLRYQGDCKLDWRM